MMRTRVKICGVRRLEDARLASELGADAIGFVFWPASPRFVDPERARAIVAELPPFVSAVGVFVDQTQEYVNGVAGLVKLSAVQLHGHEPLSEVRWIRENTALQRAAENGTGMGVRFINLSPEASAAISKFLQDRDSLFYDDED